MPSASEQAPSDPPSIVDDVQITAEPPFSVFSKCEKRTYVYCASLAGFASPVSSSIYYPALTVLARDLHTSLSNINLTITTYLILQGLAPTILGGISDRFGRRPAFLICFIIYIAANTGLALQTSFVALLILRMLQSSGSSGTIAISNGVVSDVATRAERGSYISLAALGQSLGPALGPLIGAGSILSKTAIGRLIDWNFRRHARANDIPIVKTQQTDITNFPVERARLEIGLGLVYLSCVSIIPYGWVMNMANPPLPVILILLFFNAFTTSGSMQAQNVLVVDCNPNRPAAGTAASNIARCLLGAGGVAVVMPLLNKIGRGWTSTLIAGVWVLMSAFWWAVVWWGPRWREVRREKEEAREKEKEKRDGDVNVEQGGGDMEKRVSVQVA